MTLHHKRFIIPLVIMSFLVAGVYLFLEAQQTNSSPREHTLTPEYWDHTYDTSRTLLPVFVDTVTYQAAMSDTNRTGKVALTEEQWKERLDSDEYRILREKGTELPFINEYNNFYEEGVYLCRACGNPLFHSDTKYNSRSGWPSFWEPIDEEAVGEKPDNSFFMERTETVCSRCGSHIGHVFDDGPQPTGLRYCMNSKALKFVPKDSKE